MKFKCKSCGDVVDSIEMTSSYRDEDDFCRCGGEYEEAKACKICGNYCIDEELVSNVCYNCIADGMTFENAEEFGKEENCLNYFYEYTLGIEKINSILGEYLRENSLPNDTDKIVSFLKIDLMNFADFLAEKEGE